MTITITDAELQQYYERVSQWEGRLAKYVSLFYDKTYKESVASFEAAMKRCGQYISSYEWQQRDVNMKRNTFAELYDRYVTEVPMPRRSIVDLKSNASLF